MEQKSIGEEEQSRLGPRELLENVHQSIFLGCGRKYVSWLNGLPGQPIGSLHYFSSVLQEVTSSQLSARYRTFNQMQMLRLEKRWLETDPDCDQKGGNLLGKTFPKHNRRKSRETR